MTFPPPGVGISVLVANRGEIAVRIIRTLRGLGMRSVAVHSDADAGARHVRAADMALRVPGYLDADAIIEAALASGASMIHPGYGFLAENAAFARACADAGLVFVGPPPEAIEAMGDKIQAKRTVADAGVPLLPGFAETAGQPMSDSELVAAAARVGYPLLIKPSAGGGGKGMRLVRSETELAAAAAAARREAHSAFGDATLLVERFVEQPRHIEIQVLADAHGNVVHLGERECSLQRRHQKIVEEAPSPLLTPAQRAAMGEAAVAAAKACGYVGAGTVEFIMRSGHTPPLPEPETIPEARKAADARAGRGAADPSANSSAPVDTPSTWADYFFLEMNTRLQVEHPVTEAVTTVDGVRGIDLVELQLRVAQGEPLPFTQADIGLSGHAIECRIYAEDPARDFLPTGGRALLLDEPGGHGVRVDSGLTEGAPIISDYDPMLAKIIVWGADRSEALRRVDAALSRYTLLGCGVNTAFLRALLAHPEVAAGNLSTDLTERLRPELVDGVEAAPEAVLAAAALDRQLSLEPSGPIVDPFDVPDGWRIGEPAWTSWRLHAAGSDTVTVRVRAHDRAARRFQVRVGEGEPELATAARSADGRALDVGYGGRTVRYARAETDHELWLGLDGAAWRFREETLLAPLHAGAADTDGAVRSPMPGTVLTVPVEQGDAVRAGSTVVVVEAMKMEHSVTAPIDGIVTALRASPGQSVAMDAVLAVITPAPTAVGSESASTTAEEQS